jgi:hypothetical protein
VLYDCISPDGTERTVWLYPGQDVEDVGDELTVEAELRIVRHDAAPGFPTWPG